MSKGVGFSWRMAVRFCVPFEIAKRRQGTMEAAGRIAVRCLALGLELKLRSSAVA